MSDHQLMSVINHLHGSLLQHHMMTVKQLGADVEGHWNGLVLQSTHLEVMYLASMEPPTLSTTQQLMGSYLPK